jgi:CRP-like cAMP-binding protein
MTNIQLQVLSNSSVFEGLETSQIEKILHEKVFQLKQYEKGALIAQSGQDCNQAIIIIEGKVAGEMMDLAGRILKIEDMLPSKMIAPAFLYGRKRKYPVNVIAAESSILWMMHRDEFSRLLQTNIQLLNNYLSAISNRAQFLSDKIRFLSFPSLRAKLAFFFLQNASADAIFKLPLTHQQLSELFGVARPSLSREIREMNNDGLIEADRDMIRIINIAELRDLIQ